MDTCCTCTGATVNHVQYLRKPCEHTILNSIDRGTFLKGTISLRHPQHRLGKVPLKGTISLRHRLGYVLKNYTYRNNQKNVLIRK
jgi:hypothetical protein